VRDTLWVIGAMSVAGDLTGGGEFSAVSRAVVTGFGGFSVAHCGIFGTSLSVGGLATLGSLFARFNYIPDSYPELSISEVLCPIRKLLDCSR
jgi:hypothetical protein